MVETVLARNHFDAAANSYDTAFTATHMGRQLRAMVWKRITPYLRPGMGVLDLGCGTGEDAIWLAQQGCYVLAADGSPVMLRIVAEKAARLGVSDRIETLTLDLNNPPERLRLASRFELVLSNFGALNCIADLDALGRDLARWTTPGGHVALNVMGRFCVWEFIWFLAQLRPKSLRRLRGRATASIGGERIAVYYWGIRQLKQMLRPALILKEIAGIGIALPPTYMFSHLERYPRLVAWLTRLETRLSASPVFAGLSDHTLMIFRRCWTADIP